MKLENARLIFGKSSNIKFHENPSSGNRVYTDGRTDRDGELKLKKIKKVSFRKFTNELKIQSFLCNGIHDGFYPIFFLQIGQF